MVGKSHADFPGAYIPFDKAVGPVPTVSISDTPTRSICINETWLAYLLGAMKAIGRPETWDDTYDNILYASSELAFLIGDIRDGCGVFPPTKLCLTANFADSDYGFVSSPVAPCASVYVPGTGWQSCYDAGTAQDIVMIDRFFAGTGTYVNAVTLDAVGSVLLSYDRTIELFLGGSSVYNYTDTVVGGGTTSVTVNPNVNADRMRLTISHASITDDDTLTIPSFGLCYTGLFPLSAPPDVPAYLKLYTISRDNPLVGPDSDGFYTIASKDRGDGIQVIDIDTEPGHTYNSAGPFGNMTIIFLSGTINYSDWSDNSNVIGGGGSTPPGPTVCLWRVYMAQTSGSPFTVRVRGTPC